MKKFAYFVFFLTGLLLSNIVQPQPLYGAGCTPVYGGGVDCPPTKNILIDKKVNYPNATYFVDNISVSDTKFVPGQIVTFQLIVENNGNATRKDVTVTDQLPSYVEFVSGAGSYDASNRTVTITIGSIDAGERRTFEINVRVVSLANLPSNQTVTCVVNNAQVHVGESTDDSDTAQICIEKQVLGAPQLPKSGPSETLVFAAGLTALFVVGRKLSKVSL